MPKRESNNVKRRIASPNAHPEELYVFLLGSCRYGGSAHHKKSVADYGFDRPNPRPTKSLCDGLRRLAKSEAEALLARGIERRMISDFLLNDLPKYIWSVDDEGEPYEAKIGEDGRSYHGYRLDDNERDMRAMVLAAWRVRG